MITDKQLQNGPCFVISVAARMVGLHAQTLRYYERVGLLWPSRSDGNQRLFSAADIERVRRIKVLTEDLGVNLAGAEVALKLMNRNEELEQDIQKLTDENDRLRALLATSNPRRTANNGILFGLGGPPADGRTASGAGG